MAGCNPYEEIRPVAQKGDVVEPGEEKGGVWKNFLLPGTDNSWKQAHEVPPCFSTSQKIEFLRELDRVGCRDVRAMLLIIQFLDRQNSAWLTDSEWLALGKRLAENGVWSDELLGWLIRLGKGDGLIGSDLIELARKLKLAFESEGIILDRSWMKLYTKGGAEVEILDDIFAKIKKTLLEEFSISDEVVIISGSAGYNLGGYNIGVYA